MNRDDIIRMARECGLTINDSIMYGVEHFAALVAAAERAALKAQEPVAWMDIDDAGARHGLRFWSEGTSDEVALYTDPPWRKPLTDEVIAGLWSWSMTADAERTANTQQHAFARAIERAHGIGGVDEPR